MKTKKTVDISLGGLLLFSCAMCGCTSFHGLDSITPEGVHINGTGLSFDNKRMLAEPERVAEHATFVYPSLRRIEEVPSQIVFGSGIDYAVITKRMLWGTFETVATVPVKNLLKNQFLHGTREHFHSLADGQQPAICIKVDVLGCVLAKCGAQVDSMVTLAIEIEDVVKNRVCHKKTYTARSLLPWDGGSLVPDSLYKSIQDCTSLFLKDISQDRTLIARLESVSPDA